MGQGSFHVTIIGAGLGGLCLGQALRRRGIAFDIHERDPSLTARPRGYRIRIDRTGREALAACLPSDLAALVHETCALAGSPGRFLDPQLAPFRGRSVATWHDAAADRSDEDGDLSVHRLTLREILLSGLEDRVHFGHAFAGCEPEPGGGLSLRSVDGSSVRTDLLVAADGAGSAVRRRTLIDAEPVETGAVCLNGRVGEAASGEAALTEAVATYADDLHRRATAAVRASEDAAVALFASASTPLTTV